MLSFHRANSCRTVCLPTVPGSFSSLHVATRAAAFAGTPGREAVNGEEAHPFETKPLTNASKKCKGDSQIVSSMEGMLYSDMISSHLPCMVPTVPKYTPAPAALPLWGRERPLPQRAGHHACVAEGRACWPQARCKGCALIAKMRQHTVKWPTLVCWKQERREGEAGKNRVGWVFFLMETRVVPTDVSGLLLVTRRVKPTRFKLWSIPRNYYAGNCHCVTRISN